jgi:hypothetical protein
VPLLTAATLRVAKRVLHKHSLLDTDEIKDVLQFSILCSIAMMLARGAIRLWVRSLQGCPRDLYTAPWTTKPKGYNQGIKGDYAVYVVVLQKTFEVTAWQGQPALPSPDPQHCTVYRVWAHVAPTDNKHAYII